MPHINIVCPKTNWSIAMGKVSRFQLFNISCGESLDLIEMDEDLLAPEVGILDHNTGTLRSIKGGGNYTLVPVDDHTVVTLKRVREIYEIVTKKPAALFSTSIARMDELIGAVGLLFGEISYMVVENKEDLAKLINPPSGDYEPKKKTYTILSSLIDKAELMSESDKTESTESGCGHKH